jgi:hypothetical protein
MEYQTNTIRSLLWIGVITLGGFTACNYTVGECYPRGEADGAADVGVGVGPSGAGGYGDMPPGGGGTGANACNAAPDSPSGEGAPTPAPPNDGTELGTYVRCRGLGPMDCEALCFDIGAKCAGLKTHPYGSQGGTGRLKQCQSNAMNHTCTYCYENGDYCTFLYTVFTPTGTPLCGYNGGKGCE